MPDLIGQSIDRYHILEKIGENGRAIVYKAYDTHLECEVANKVICTDQVLPATFGSAMNRFEPKAREVAKLVQPDISKVINYD